MRSTMIATSGVFLGLEYRRGVQKCVFGRSWRDRDRFSISVV